MPKRFHRAFLTGWIVILVLLCGIGAGCGSKGEESAPPIVPTTSAPEGFYEDTFHGFSIHYPSAWVPEKGKAGEAVFSVSNAGRSCMVQVFVESVPKDTSREAWARTALDTVKPKVSRFVLLSESEVQLGDAIAHEHVFTGDDPAGPITVKLLSLVRDGTGFIVAAACEADLYELLEEAINNIVYSFRAQQPILADLKREEYLSLVDFGPITLDPAIMRDTASAYYIMEIFSGLVTLNRDLEVVPDLAERWEVSSDGTVYTFHLRPDACFQDGKPITARDFKYSFERACDPATGSETAAEYLGDIVGVKEKLAGQAAEIAGVRIVDDHTLEITIDAPKAYFIAKLVYPTAFVVDEENVNTGPDWWRHPNGSGPFKLAAWEPDEMIVLERNDRYYGEKPRIRYAIYHLWAGIPMTMYENGEIDITSVSGSDIERVLDPLSPLHDELVTVPDFSASFIAFNAERPPFDDPNVRRAFSLAVDREKIARVLGQGLVEPAAGILPPGFPGFNENLRGPDYDPEKAREALEQSRYGGAAGLPPITLTTSGLGSVSPIYEAMIAMWRENLGVNVQVRQIEPERYPYVIEEEKDEMFEIGWVADFPDPQNFLDVLFHSASRNNAGGYSNPAVDAKLEAARRELDESARFPLYQEAEQMLMDDAACLPLFTGSSYVLVKPYVKGFPASPLPIPWLKYISIEPEE